MSIKKIKNSILESLPRPLAKQLYLVRNSETVISSKAYKNYHFDLAVPKRNQLWVNRLQQPNGHEPAICEWFEKYLNEDDIYVDVGSAFGFFPALISQMHPKVKIHAFEAGWQQFHFLTKNAKSCENGTKWTIQNKYIGNQNNQNTVRLDDYCQAHGFVPSIIQIDVDGAENEVLSGAKEIISKGKTEFLLELHPLILGEFNTSVEEVLANFKDNYEMKILPDLRNNNMVWSNDLTLIEKDDNPYLYIYPSNKARF